MIRKLVVFASVLGTIAFFAGFIIIAGSLRPEVQVRDTPPPAPITYVKTVAYTPLALSVSTQGEVQPRRQITLAPEIGGRIREVSSSFANGGVFRKGDVLVTIDDAEYRLAVTRARAKVATARQQLAVEEAEAALAARDYAELSGREVGDDTSVLALRKPQLAAAQAELAAAQADLAEAQLGLSRTRIVAPFTGRVRTTSADVGQYVGPGTNLGEVFATDIAQIPLPLSDSDLAKLGLAFAFEAEGVDAPLVTLSASVAGQLRSWQGRIRRVDAAIDSLTRQISAIAEVKDPYGEGSDKGFPLAFGLFVNAVIEGPELPRATVVPFLSMRDDGQVYVVDDQDKLRLRTPQVIAQIAEGLVAVGGLTAGERLVISPVTATVGSTVRPQFQDGTSASILVDIQEGAASTAERQTRPVDRPKVADEGQGANL